MYMYTYIYTYSRMNKENEHAMIICIHNRHKPAQTNLYEVHNGDTIPRVTNVYEHNMCGLRLVKKLFGRLEDAKAERHQGALIGDFHAVQTTNIGGVEHRAALRVGEPRGHG